MQGRIPVSLDKTTEINCERCGNTTFEEILLIRKASRFITQTQQDALIPIPVFACHNCSHINEEFLPLEMQTRKDDDLI